MLTNETFLLESAHQTSSKLISKAPKCTIESFQLLLGAIDYINDNGGQETFPKLLIYDDTAATANHHTTTTTITEELSNSNSIEEDYIPPSLTISDESEDKSSEDEQASTTQTQTITTPKSKSNNSKHSNSSNTNGKARGGHYRNGVDDSSLICSCCKRDSSSVSFLKNYSIHAGNIDNYRNTFPDYDVVPGISCMTCYHKSWRYSKGLYDPNKARGTVNKREGIQKSPSPSSSTPSSSTRKKNSSQKRKSNSNAVVEQQQLDNEVNSSEDVKSKPRKISKRRQNSSPSSNQSNGNDNSNQNDLEFENQMNENQSYTTSTYENSQGLHHSLRLVLKFVWIEQGDDGEVYSCPMSLDFVPTTLTSIKSLVIGKLKTKLSGYECDSIVWCHDNQKTLLTDTELQQKALRNDDILIVNVK